MQIMNFFFFLQKKKIGTNIIAVLCVFVSFQIYCQSLKTEFCQSLKRGLVTK